MADKMGSYEHIVSDKKMLSLTRSA